MKSSEHPLYKHLQTLPPILKTRGGGIQAGFWRGYTNVPRNVAMTGTRTSAAWVAWIAGRDLRLRHEKEGYCLVPPPQCWK